MLNFAVLVSIKNWGGYHASPIHSVQIAFLKIGYAPPQKEYGKGDGCLFEVKFQKDIPEVPHGGCHLPLQCSP